MTFYNNTGNIVFASKESLKKNLLITIPSFLLAMFTLIIALKYYENRVFILLITFIFGSLSVLAGLFIGQKKFKREYNKYALEIDSDSIKIKSIYCNNLIKINTIKKITIDEKESILLHTVNGKSYFVSKYLDNLNLLIESLDGIKKIEHTVRKNSIFQYIPWIFFCGIFLVRFIPDYHIYLVFAFGFVITSIIATIQLLLSQIKKRYIIFSLVINSLLIVIVSRNIYIIFERMLK